MSRSIVLAGTLLAFAVLSAPASGHVRIDGTWLFSESTYSADQPRDAPPDMDSQHRSDPVNVIWRGPFPGATARVNRVMEHTEAHWRERRIPGRYPRGAFMRPRESALCSDPQLVFYRDSGSQNSGGWTQSTGYMSTNGLCANQYHTRLIHSGRHSLYFPAADNQDEWVLAPIHHEEATIEDMGHAPDRPFDHARSAYIHALRPHCRERGWAMNDDAATDYQEFPNTGIISRISFRHAAIPEGCDGA